MTSKKPAPALSAKYQRSIRKAMEDPATPAVIVSKSSTRKGYTTVQLADGQEIDVYNPSVPNTPNRRVLIGYPPYGTRRLQVLGDRDNYVDGTEGVTPDHHESHEFWSRDTVWTQKGQIVPLLVLPAGDFLVKLWGDIIYADGTWVVVDNQELDLASYQPAAGAEWLLLEIDNTTGVMSAVEGTLVDARELLNTSNLPVPDADCTPICAVMVYDGQTELQRNPNGTNDFLDLRWGGYASGGFPDSIIVGTRSSILSSTPTGPTVALASDEPALYVWTGSGWVRNAIPLGTPSTGVDIGALPYNDDHGYGVLDLSDKDLHNIVLKGYNTDRRSAQEGALRKTALTATTNAIQAYINSAWRTLLAYSTAQEDAIMLWTDGWSDVDTFGKNMIHGHKVDMGAFASDHIRFGGNIGDQTP